MGGLGGAIASSGTGGSEVASMVNKAQARGHTIGVHRGRAAGLQEGYDKGRAAMVKSMPTGEFTEGARAEMLAAMLQKG